VNEFRLWSAFYVLEAEDATPPEHRTRRPGNRAEACQELNRLFGVGA
jgi:hypothetical protein